MILKLLLSTNNFTSLQVSSIRFWTFKQEKLIFEPCSDAESYEYSSVRPSIHSSVCPSVRTSVTPFPEDWLITFSDFCIKLRCNKSIKVTESFFGEKILLWTKWGTFLGAKINIFEIFSKYIHSIYLKLYLMAGI